MKRLILFFIFINFGLLYGYVIDHIDAKINITGTQKKVVHTVQMKIENDAKEFYFSYPIQEESEILPILLSLKNSKFYRVYLKNKRVFFIVSNVRKNEKLTFNISYKTINNQPFLQVQKIYIPHFKNNFQANIKVSVDKDWFIFSKNTSLKEQQYRWKGKVSHKDFSDYLWLSIKEANFEISMQNYIFSTEPIESLNLFLPKYFKDGDIKVKKITFESRPKNAKIIQNNNNTAFAFRFEKTQDFVATMKAEIYNSINQLKYDSLNPKDFESKSQKPYLKQLAQHILQTNQEDPPYIAIAKWLNHTIKYNEKYMGYHMDTEEILRLKSGVCEHYAQVYNDLMQSIDIPSVFVTGMGFNPIKKSFEFHAWNLVFVDKKWIPIDATWGLFSGILPVSHIFLYVGYQPLMMYETYEVKISETHSETKHKIKFIPQK